MMEAISISKKYELTESSDFKFLKEKGIEHLRNLAGRVWTDHNQHDPGVTILDEVCFAITDLSYRTKLPIEDLIALSQDEKTNWQTKYPAPHYKNRYNDFEKQGLFEAHKILPTHPWTVLDYRKLLLKVEGVRNAWFVPHCGTAEQAIYIDCENKEASFSSFEYTFKSGKCKGEKVRVLFPNANSYIQNYKFLNLKKLDSKDSKGQHYKTELTFNKPFTKKETVVEIVNFTFDKNKRDFPKECIQSLFDKSSQETFWNEFWEKLIKIERAEISSLKLNGLYEVLLELEPDSELGSLADRHLHYKIPSGDLAGVEIVFKINDDLPEWPELESVEELVSVTQVFDDKSQWKIVLKLKINGETYLIKDAYINIINDKPRSNEAAINITRHKLTAALGNPIALEEYSILATYWRKQNKINHALKRVCCVLDAHRNLCEDFYKIDLVQTDNVGACMDIKVKNGADIEVLMAHITLVLEQYFNPPIKKYSLSEMLDDGYKANDIFNGPYVDYNFSCQGGSSESVFTKAGFIKNKELEKAQLKSTLYTSDIINLIMDFEDVITVKNVMLRRFDDEGLPMGPSEKWCLSIPPGKQAVFTPAVSKVLFYKDNVPFTAKKTETEETLKVLRAQAKKNAYVEPFQRFDVNLGRSRFLDKFYPIQDDLPDIYGTSPLKLTKRKTSENLANTKNLKAYLLFYEQIFADYLQQLNNLKWILSPEEIDQSFFSKYINGDDITALTDDFENEYYINSLSGAPLLKDEKIRKRLYERDYDFLEKRNAMLDHLLSRFAESFGDYALMLYKIKGDRVSSGQDLIVDKINFLNVYPKLSREKGKAFNYRPSNSADIWDSDNVSGLENRLGLLLGLEDTSKRYLHCQEINSVLVKSRKISGQAKWEIRFYNEASQLLFKSIERYNSISEANNIVSTLACEMRNPSNYSFSDSGKLVLTVKSHSITSNLTFNNRGEYELILSKIFNAYDFLLEDELHCGKEANEGMYLIEHILLRPMFDGTKDTLMDYCYPENCQSCTLEDAYSFRYSLILPYWPGRFNNMDFRRYFERTVRLETPAHILPKICWISNEQMKVFGEKYKVWLNLKSSKHLDKNIYNKALAELLTILEQIQTVYPQATLHDCEEDGGENPVTLGNTSLGSF